MACADAAMSHFLTLEELCELALSEARSILPLEVSMFLRTPDALAEVAEMCGNGGDRKSDFVATEADTDRTANCGEHTIDFVAQTLANQLVDLLWAPLGGCISTIHPAPAGSD